MIAAPGAASARWVAARRWEQIAEERWRELLARLQRNDATLASIDPVCYNSGHGDAGFSRTFDNARALQLGRALVQQGNNNSNNTSLRRLKLDASHLRMPGTINTNNNAQAADIFAPLLAFIATSPNLERLDLVLWNADPRIAQRFLQAAASNHQHLRSLQILLPVREHLDAVTHLLRTTPTVRELVLKSFRGLLLSNGADDGDDGDDTAANELARALGGNQTLTSLTLEDTMDHEHTVRCIQLILQQLEQHPRLETLCLCNMSASVLSHAAVALHALKRLSPALRELQLCGFVVHDEATIRCLHSGLQASRTIQTLTVQNCKFNKLSARAFQEAFQPGSCAVESLHLDANEGLDIDLAAACAYRAGDTHNTNKKAQLRELHLENTHALLGTSASNGSTPDCAKLFRGLGENASRMTLQRLFISDHLDSTALKELSKCLPKLVYLKEIHLRLWGNGSQRFREKILEGLRLNGSLERVGLALSQNFAVSGQRLIQDKPFFLDKQMTQVRQYCRRNEAIPALITELQSPAQRNGREEAPVDIYPKIFHRAQECRATRLTWCLAGLLSLSDDEIGPHSGDESKYS